MENRTFVDGITKYEIEARIAYNTAGDNTIYIPECLQSTCFDRDLENRIQNRIDTIMSETNGEWPITMIAFVSYLYDKYKVDPADLEFLFTFVTQLSTAGIEKTSKLIIETILGMSTDPDA